MTRVRQELERPADELLGQSSRALQVRAQILSSRPSVLAGRSPPGLTDLHGHARVIPAEVAGRLQALLEQARI